MTTVIQKTSFREISRPLLMGAVGTFVLVGAYFAIVGSISGSGFAVSQFERFWYYLIALALGFGIQIGLYAYLKQFIKNNIESKGVVAVSGTTSTAAMISCCAHYLGNIVPLIATAGILTLAAQYQIQLFWVGLLFNLVGITYIASKVTKLAKLS